MNNAVLVNKTVETESYAMVVKVRVKTVDEVKAEVLLMIEASAAKRGIVGNEDLAELKEVARNYGASFEEVLAAAKRGFARKSS